MREPSVRELVAVAFSMGHYAANMGGKTIDLDAWENSQFPSPAELEHVVTFLSEIGLMESRLRHNRRGGLEEIKYRFAGMAEALNSRA